MMMMMIKGGMHVSIPQSGFGAFELETANKADVLSHSFQSLSRDSGRLNGGDDHAAEYPADSFNPSVGIRGV